MTEIYLIRHTQAEGNRYRMMQGYWDGEVTALGLRQADALGRRFANSRWMPSIPVTSPVLSLPLKPPPADPGAWCRKRKRFAS